MGTSPPPTTSPPPAAPPPSAVCVALYGDCTAAGSTCCGPNTCYRKDEYYSQCLTACPMDLWECSTQTTSPPSPATLPPPFPLPLPPSPSPSKSPTPPSPSPEESFPPPL